MSRKSRIFLALACLAMSTSLVMQFVPELANNGVRGFSSGFAAAMMVGVLITWNKQKNSPQT